MAAGPQLTFLYPNIFRVLPLQASTSSVKRARAKFHHAHQSCYRTTSWKQQSEVRTRYGTANEPLLHAPTNTQSPTTGTAKKTNTTAKMESALPKKVEQAALPSPADKSSEEKKKGKDVDSSPDPPKVSPKPPDGECNSQEVPSDSIEKPSEAPSHVQQPSTDIKPLETVLRMEPPSSAREERQRNKPPHLVTPPYVHHFDTFTLVRDLEKGGFSQEQAVTCMKGVRSLLAINMDLAREGLVSKSDVENESYLFKAACSELKTEIQNQRRQEMEKMRTARTQLQHEVDILGQRMGQETASLKEEMKGMFDDRKISVKMEQRSLESSIQQINHHITVALNSDSRSEVEGLRWILTRRAGMAIVACAVMMLGGASYISRIEAEEKAFLKKQAKQEREQDSGGNRGGDGASPQRDKSQDGMESAGEVLANLSTKEGNSPGYISLG
ncbi:MAG: hypothetical protein M1820_010196 [Bogoriella megaspora]|nr:MAG: hypothetical protein M1820_010196 [Bogoriella megaspora]